MHIRMRQVAVHTPSSRLWQTICAIACAALLGLPTLTVTAATEAQQARMKVDAILAGLEKQASAHSAISSVWPPLRQSPCTHPATHPKGHLIVGYSYSSRANPWQVQNAIGGVWYLQHQPEVATVYSANGEENPSKQISDIEGLIAKGINLLVIDPTTTAVSPGVQEACQRGIPVVVYDRFVTPVTNVTASMYANEVLDGYNGGMAIVKALKGRGNVVIIPGIPGAGVTEDRVKGAKMALATAPGIHILGLAYSNWDVATGRKVTEDFLTKYPQIDAIWSDSGVQAVGIIEALQAAHRLNQIKMLVGGQENGYLKLWYRLGFHGYGSTISTDVGILASQLGIDIATGRFMPKSNIPAPLVVIDQAHLKQYVRMDLPDSYWATQILPNSVLAQIFKAQ